MRLNQYFPEGDDPELNDFVRDVTTLLNGGQLSFAVTTTAPTSTTGAADGELRLVYLSATDVRLYALVNGVWSYASIGRPVQSGWSYITVSGTPASQTQAVTFPSTFSTAPFVLCSYIGVKTGTAPTAPSQFTGANTLRIMSAYAPTTAGFTVAVYTGNGSNLTNAEHAGFAWVAYGV